jgi:hypothetical protein
MFNFLTKSCLNINFILFLYTSAHDKNAITANSICITSNCCIKNGGELHNVSHTILLYIKLCAVDDPRSQPVAYLSAQGFHNGESTGELCLGIILNA